MQQKVQQKKQQRQRVKQPDRRDWFRLDKPLDVHWLPLHADQLPDLEQLDQGLPQVLRLSSELRQQLAQLPHIRHDDSHGHRNQYSQHWRFQPGRTPPARQTQLIQQIWAMTSQKADALLSQLLLQEQTGGKRGCLTEISAGGGRLRVPAPMPVATHLQLLLLPPEPGHPMVLAAEITRRTVRGGQNPGGQSQAGHAELALHWARIRYQDQETLARCTLSWQAARLRQQSGR